MLERCVVCDNTPRNKIKALFLCSDHYGEYKFWIASWKVANGFEPLGDMGDRNAFKMFHDFRNMIRMKERVEAGNVGNYPLFN